MALTPFLQHYKDTPGLKPIKPDDFALARAAAIAFAEDLGCQASGATPSQIVERALLDFFAANNPALVCPKTIKNIVKGLQTVSKMGIDWNVATLPPHIAIEHGFLKPLPEPPKAKQTLGTTKGTMKLDMIDTVVDTVCASPVRLVGESRRGVSEKVSLRPEVWSWKSGRLKIVLKGRNEIGYCHRPGATGAWTVYRGIGEDSEQLAKDVATGALGKTVVELFGSGSLVEVDNATPQKLPFDGGSPPPAATPQAPQVTRPRDGIQNPNSSNQGTDPRHTEHPLHDTITKNGYQYSHTTPIIDPAGKEYLHDTYKKGERVVGVDRGDKKESSYLSRWTTSKSTASGRQTRGRGGDLLNKHLKTVR